MPSSARTLPNLIVANGEPLVWGRRTYVMGIINLSPDSFSGDGLGSDIPAIVVSGGGGTEHCIAVEPGCGQGDAGARALRFGPLQFGIPGSHVHGHADSRLQTSHPSY